MYNIYYIITRERERKKKKTWNSCFPSQQVLWTSIKVLQPVYLRYRFQSSYRRTITQRGYGVSSCHAILSAMEIYEWNRLLALPPTQWAIVMLLSYCFFQDKLKATFLLFIYFYFIILFFFQSFHITDIMTLEFFFYAQI